MKRKRKLTGVISNHDYVIMQTIQSLSCLHKRLPGIATIALFYQLLSYYGAMVIYKGTHALA